MKPTRAWPRLTDLVTYYERSLEALNHLDAAARLGRAVSFSGMSAVEVGRALSEMRTELDLEVSLGLMAAAEALLRVDYRERVTRKLKQPAGVRRRLSALWKTSENRASLESILDVWKEEVGQPDLFAAFQEYLQLRHWLAHGRYWTLKKSARRAEPQDVLRVLDDLFGSLPHFNA